MGTGASPGARQRVPPVAAAAVDVGGMRRASEDWVRLAPHPAVAAQSHRMVGAVRATGHAPCPVAAVEGFGANARMGV